MRVVRADIYRTAAEAFSAAPPPPAHVELDENASDDETDAWFANYPPFRVAVDVVVAHTRAEIAEEEHPTVEALYWLVRLHDGPRDAAYERDKPIAWQRARDALGAPAHRVRTTAASTSDITVEGPEGDTAVCSCGGAQWVDDENWSPEFLGEKRVPGAAGRLPCGFCNHGGWDVPDPADATTTEDGER